MAKCEKCGFTILNGQCLCTIEKTEKSGNRCTCKIGDGKPCGLPASVYCDGEWKCSFHNKLAFYPNKNESDLFKQMWKDKIYGRPAISPLLERFKALYGNKPTELPTENVDK